MSQGVRLPASYFASAEQAAHSTAGAKPYKLTASILFSRPAGSVHGHVSAKIESFDSNHLDNLQVTTWFLEEIAWPAEG